MRHARLSEKCTFMSKGVWKHDHRWATEDIKKNIRSWTIMHEKTIICETEYFLREVLVHVQ